MMSFDELRQAEGELKGRIEHLHEFLHIDERREEMAELEKKMAAPDFWNDKESAQNTVAQLSGCRNLVEPFRRLESEVEDYSVALELAGEDEEFLKEAEIAYRRLLKSLDRMEIMSFLSGKFDRNNLYFSIHAGAGGTESCDWANMLLRMYRRFFERRGWKDEVIDLQPGEEAGVKSVTLHVTGEFSYGYMKGEKGVHRLVRISPFDSNARRHTSFCSWMSSPNSMTTSRWRSTRPSCGSTPTAPAARAGSTSTPPTRRSDHPPADRHRGLLPERAFTAQEPRHGDEDAESQTLRIRGGEAPQRGGCDPRRERWRTAGAARSAAMCFSPTRWSRTCGPKWRPAIPPGCSTERSISLSRRI